MLPADGLTVYKAVDPEGLVTPAATILVSTEDATVARVAVLLLIAFVPELQTILSSDRDELR